MTNDQKCVHYDTFPQIKINRDAAVEQFRLAGRTLRLLAVGESHEYEKAEAYVSVN